MMKLLSCCRVLTEAELVLSSLRAAARIPGARLTSRSDRWVVLAFGFSPFGFLVSKLPAWRSLAELVEEVPPEVVLVLLVRRRVPAVEVERGRPLEPDCVLA